VTRSIALALLAALAACATPPPEAVATPVGIVRADDTATARWIAAALQRAAERLERLAPAVAPPRVEVWVVADPGEGDEGVVGRAKRGPWSARWTLHVDADSGWAMVGHELFHARYQEHLRGWPPALIEGLADRFGLSDDILGDCVRMDRLMALARVRVPSMALEYRRHDGTQAGVIGAFSTTVTEGPPPLSLERVGELSASELVGLDYPERLYAYGVGYAAAQAWLGDEGVDVLPATPPRWSELPLGTAEELARRAEAEFGPERVHRWAVARFAGEIVRILREDVPGAVSVDEALATIEFWLTVDTGPKQPLEGDADFRELLELLWPLIEGDGGAAAAP